MRVLALTVLPPLAVLGLLYVLIVSPERAASLAAQQRLADVTETLGRQERGALPVLPSVSFHARYERPVRPR